MDFNGWVRNIGLYATETSNFRGSAWAERINSMDEAWVINTQMVTAARTSGVTVPLSIVPHATDITRFQRSYEPLDALKPYKKNGDFLFYFVGEAVRRKNLSALLKAFHTEFDENEPVQLVIKATRPGLSPADTKQYLTNYCSEVKRGLKLHTYKDEILVTDRLTEQGLMRLHSACDCFVMPSHGEAWCIPAFDAMAMGKTPIVTDWSGFKDYVTPETGWLVKHRMEPAFAAIETFDDLYTGKEAWASVDLYDLRRCMREAFEDGQLKAEKAFKGIEKAYDFSYAAVGRTMRELLNGNQTSVGGPS
jgi:glycosyltransferase involved in cell wall biosynthesis